MRRVAVNIRFVRPGHMEGMGIHTYEVLKRLMEKHTDIEWHLISDPQLKKLPESLSNAVWHRVFPPARHPLLFKWWYDYTIPRVLKKIKAELFWSPDNFCSLKTDIPQILTVHDLAYLHYPDFIGKRMLAYYQKNTPLFIKKAAHIVTVSHFSAEDICNRFKKNKKDITVCHNGFRSIHKSLHLQVQQEVKNKYAQGEDFFLYIGSFHPRKNIAQLIRAFNLFKVKGTRTKLILAGRAAWQVEDIKNELENSPYREDIIYLERYVEPSLVHQLTASALAFCYVSLFEGFGLSIVESMAAGTPVITSDRGATKEIGGDAALLADPDDAHSIALQMERIENDGSLREELIQKGFRNAQQYTWQKTADCYTGVLESLF